MSITLGSITLPDGMLWPDEFADGAIAAVEVRVLSGALVRQYKAKNGGRKITLVGGWATRATVILLKALQDTGSPATLTLHDSRTFSVCFADASALSATPVINYHTPATTDYYELELHLVEVAS